jgi:hypothetical protein
MYTYEDDDKNTVVSERRTVKKLIHLNWRKVLFLALYMLPGFYREQHELHDQSELRPRQWSSNYLILCTVALYSHLFIILSPIRSKMRKIAQSDFHSDPLVSLS